MEVGGVFFDVRRKGQKILVDESRNFIISIGLGLQPSASASSRCGAEINQQGLLGGFGFGQSLVSIFLPFDSHTFTSRE